MPITNGSPNVSGARNFFFLFICLCRGKNAALLACPGNAENTLFFVRNRFPCFYFLDSALYDSVCFETGMLVWADTPAVFT